MESHLPRYPEVIIAIIPINAMKIVSQSDVREMASLVNDVPVNFSVCDLFLFVR